MQQAWHQSGLARIDDGVLVFLLKLFNLYTKQDHHSGPQLHLSLVEYFLMTTQNLKSKHKSSITTKFMSILLKTVQEKFSTNVAKPWMDPNMRVVCGSLVTRNLQLHHLSFQSLGRVWDNSSSGSREKWSTPAFLWQRLSSRDTKARESDLEKQKALAGHPPSPWQPKHFERFTSCCYFPGTQRHKILQNRGRGGLCGPGPMLGERCVQLTLELALLAKPEQPRKEGLVTALGPPRYSVHCNGDRLAPQAARSGPLPPTAHWLLVFM